MHFVYHNNTLEYYKHNFLILKENKKQINEKKSTVIVSQQVNNVGIGMKFLKNFFESFKNYIFDRQAYLVVLSEIRKKSIKTTILVN
jgi:hypothetical protein